MFQEHSPAEESRAARVRLRQPIISVTVRTHRESSRLFIRLQS